MPIFRHAVMLVYEASPLGAHTCFFAFPVFEQGKKSGKAVSRGAEGLPAPRQRYIPSRQMFHPFQCFQLL